MKNLWNKTIKILIDFIPNQGIHSSSSQKLLAWMHYILESLILLSCILTSSSAYNFGFIQSFALIVSMMVIRIGVSAFYMMRKIKCLVIVSKILSITCIFLLRSQIFFLSNIFQLLMQSVYNYSKENRKGNFDSRLFLNVLSIKSLLIQICQVITVCDTTTGRGKLFNLLIMSIIIYLLTLEDFIYNKGVKRILESIWLCTIIFSGYAIILQNLKVDNILLLMVGMVLIAGLLMVLILREQNQKNFKWIFENDFEQLQTNDKIKYISCLINLIESKQQLLASTFINHYEKIIKNYSAAFKYYKNQEKSSSLKYVQKYLELILQRNIHLHPTIRMLYLFYHDNISYQVYEQLHTDNFIEHRQKMRIEQSRDKSCFDHLLQESHDGQKLIFYLEFLQYLQGETIDLNYCQKVGLQLIQIRTQFIQHDFLANTSFYQPQTVNLLFLLYRNVLHIKPHQKQSKYQNKSIELFNNEKPIMIVGSEDQKLGQIININKATEKLIGYTEHQLKGKHVNILLPPQFHKPHEIILDEANKRTIYDNQTKTLHQKLFIKCKNGYTTFIYLKVSNISLLKGRRWLVQLDQIGNSMIVVNQNRVIMGVNEKSKQNGIDIQAIGKNLNKQLFDILIQKKSHKLTQKYEIVENQEIILQKQQFWTLENQLLHEKYNLPKFYIFQIKKSVQRQALKKLSILYQPNHQSKSLHLKKYSKVQFQFNIDPYNMCYTSESVQPLAHQIIQKKYQQQVLKEKKINYGEGINQMVYINNSLEFRQNNLYDQIEYDSHPAQKQQKKKYSNLKPINIQNFQENFKTISNKYPSQNYWLLILSSLGFLACFLALIMTFIVCLDMYKTVNETQKVERVMRDRRQLYTKIADNMLMEYLQNKSLIDLRQQQNYTQSYFFAMIEENSKMIQKINPSYLSLLVKQLPKKQLNYSTLNDMETDFVITGSKSTPTLQQIKKSVTLVISGLITACIDVSDILVSDIRDKQLEKFQQRGKISLLVCGSALCLIFVFLHIVINRIKNKKNNLLQILATFKKSQIENLHKKIEDIQLVFENKLQLDKIQNESKQNEIMNQDNYNLISKRIKKSFSSSQKSLYLLIIIFIALFAYSFISYYYTINFNINIDPFQNINQVLSADIRILKQIWIMVCSYNLPVTFPRITVESELKRFYSKYQNTKYLSIIQLNSNSDKISQQFKYFYESLFTSQMCKSLELGQQCNDDYYGVISTGLDQLIIKMARMMKDLNNQAKSNYWNKTLANKINYLKKFYLDQITQKNIYIFHQIDNILILTKNKLYIMYFVSLAIFLCISILLIYWGFKKSENYNNPLKILVTLIPSNILLQNNSFKIWYYQIYDQQVY